jgi:hypothetical protein
LLLRLSLQLGECDLGLGLHTLQIHFALNLQIEGHVIFTSQQTLNADEKRLNHLHVAERCGLLCRYGDSSGELLLDQFLKERVNLRAEQKVI